MSVIACGGSECEQDSSVLPHNGTGRRCETGKCLNSCSLGEYICWSAHGGIPMDQWFHSKTYY